MEAVLQVQDRAPVDLLLGTDTLAKLGFSFHEEGEEQAANLLPEQSGPTTQNPVPTVRLLHTMRLPARYSRLVRVGISESQEGSVNTFLSLTWKPLVQRVSLWQTQWLVSVLEGR